MKVRTCGTCEERKGCREFGIYGMGSNYAEKCERYSEQLKPCPFCGKKVKIHGGNEEWKPSFYDPDSGGDPYNIHCECGCEFDIGFCDYSDFRTAWNKRVN